MSRLPCGIYKITNLKNNKIYIGQSKNFFKRKKQHFTSLKRGKHPNKEMQEDYKRDWRSFRWDIVEYCNLSELNDREHYWIIKTDAINKGYNKGWVPYKRKK